MIIQCEPKYVAQEEGINRFYRAEEVKTGLHALGSTHFQAISNLLGILYGYGVPVYHGESNKK